METIGILNVNHYLQCNILAAVASVARHVPPHA